MSTFILFHVVISLIALASGFLVIGGFLASVRQNGWNSLFLWTTIATNVTGLLFPFTGFLPSHGVAILSLVILAVALYARYGAGLAGSWRSIYAVGAVSALYLNVFVLIVQQFQKIPALAALAPTQSEPAFLLTQLATLVAFVMLGVAAVRGFRLEGKIRPHFAAQ